MLGALCCGALIVEKLVEETVTFAYAGGLIAVGLVLWLIARRYTEPGGELDAEQLRG